MRAWRMTFDLGCRVHVGVEPQNHACAIGHGCAPLALALARTVSHILILQPQSTSRPSLYYQLGHNGSAECTTCTRGLVSQNLSTVVQLQISKKLGGDPVYVARVLTVLSPAWTENDRRTSAACIFMDLWKKGGWRSNFRVPDLDGLTKISCTICGSAHFIAFAVVVDPCQTHHYRRCARLSCTHTLYLWPLPFSLIFFSGESGGPRWKLRLIPFSQAVPLPIFC